MPTTVPVDVGDATTIERRLDEIMTGGGAAAIPARLVQALAELHDLGARVDGAEPAELSALDEARADLHEEIVRYVPDLLTTLEAQVDRSHRACAQFTRLTEALHAAQKHPDFEYTVTFGTVAPGSSAVSPADPRRVALHNAWARRAPWEANTQVPGHGASHHTYPPAWYWRRPTTGPVTA